MSGMSDLCLAPNVLQGVLFWSNVWFYLDIFGQNESLCVFDEQTLSVSQTFVWRLIFYSGMK